MTRYNQGSDYLLWVSDPTGIHRKEIVIDLIRTMHRDRFYLILGAMIMVTCLALALLISGSYMEGSVASGFGFLLGVLNMISWHKHAEEIRRFEEAVRVVRDRAACALRDSGAGDR